MKKKQKGFTLVELIVVIAIIGILAAILAPNLVKYIKDAKLTTANKNATTIYTAVESYAATCASTATALTEENCQGVVAEFKSTDAVTPAEGNKEIGDAVNEALGKKAVGSVWAVKIGANGFPTDAFYAKSKTDKYIGGHPTAKNEVSAKTFEAEFPADPYGAPGDGKKDADVPAKGEGS